MHYAVYPGASTLLDRVILDIVEPAVLQATGIESALRWFFLRYTDGLGVHVRLRFSGTAGALHEVSQCVVPAMREELRDIAEGRTEADCIPGFYEPEIDKYGGPQGLAAAERLFQASSELALEVIRHGARDDRRIWALAAMATTGRAMLPGRPVDLMRFWRRYERYWGAEGEGSARVGRPLSPGSLEADVDEVQNRLASVASFPEIATAFDRWQRELRIHRRVLVDLGLASADSAFHQVHLLNNRLGVPPAAEASLTRVVRSLVSLESPAATIQHHSARWPHEPTSTDERHMRS